MTNLDYLYDKAAVAKYFCKNHYVERKLHFKILEHATVLPHKHLFVNGRWTWGFGGLVDSRNEFVKESFVHYGVGDVYTPTEEIQHSPSTVVYLGLFYPVWGHCLTDNLRRLWFLTSDTFKRYFKDCAQIYLPWSNGGGYFEQQKNFRRLLEVAGVDVYRLQPVTQPTQFANVILPDESFFVDGDTSFFTDEYREMIDRIKDFALKNRTPSPKKIYFFYERSQVGEERLAEYLHSKGYEIISPELLTLDEQLNLLINADSFASTGGSCAHNSVFLRDGTEVIMIFRAGNKISEPSNYQEAINQICNLNVTYIDSSLSTFNCVTGPFCFILSRQLKEFFGDTFDGYTDDDFKIFLSYVRFCMSHGFKQNDAATKYYSALLQEFWPQLAARKDLLEAYGVQLL